MKKLLLPCLAAATAATFAFASPADDLAAAAKKLGDAANYSWTATTEIANSQFPAMPSSGVTEKGGYTIITRSFNGNAMQTVRKGDQIVMQNQEGAWMTMEEIRAQFASRGGGGGGRSGGRGGPGMFGGQANPAEDAANLIAKIKEAKIVDGVLTATLSAEDAAPLLSFGGRGGRGGSGNPPPAPTNASGSVKFWLKDGALVKYVVNVRGTISFGGEDRDIDRTTTTEFQNVGSTKVNVPEEAMKKLGA